MVKDNYIISESSVKEPPVGIFKSLRFLGPGFILSASIVGSGELIATTALGAKAGFTAFWVIILSCLVKVAVQLEFGKHTIQTGGTVMQAFGLLPGSKHGKRKWAVWFVFILTLLKVVQVAGILGGSALVLQLMFPYIPFSVLVIGSATIAGALIYKGWYVLVEKISLVMMVLFTALTLICLFYVQYTPYAFTVKDVITGMDFSLTGEQMIIALGAFGITGVASDEIIAYTYWCIEKGYAAYTGPVENTEEWRNRAGGWIKVMYLDAVAAMIVYTSVTAAFYLLGASILHKQGLVPDGDTMVTTLAGIYTSSLGKGAENIFLIGAFFVLFSSVFASLAYWSRLFTDIAGQFKWIDFYDRSDRAKMIKGVSILFPALWSVTYLFIKLPLIMIISGGIVGSVLLVLVVYAAIHFRYNRKPNLQSSPMYDAALWVSVVSILGISIYSLYSLFA
jgi:manganese transport protein